jgi:uncharacterized protein (TIGR03084 family)
MALPGVHLRVQGTDAVDDRRHGSAEVASGRFDLHDLGAQVRQNPSTSRAGDDLRQVQDTHSFEWSRYGHDPTIGGPAAGITPIRFYDGAIDPLLLTDLADEQAALDQLLASLPAADWDRSTPAAGWSIADQVEHLAASERAAALALAGRSDEVFGGRAKEPARRAREPAALLDEWRTARAATRAALAAHGDRDRVMWGAGPMSARSFADARLMETWAHGLDCHAALGSAPVDTVRLRRIAGLGFRALPYAFSLAKDQPPGDVRTIALDLRAPDGTPWRYGPAGTADVIAGPAGEWCRVATRRRRAEDTSLRAATPLAALALKVARAYLAD